MQTPGRAVGVAVITKSPTRIVDAHHCTLQLLDCFTGHVNARWPNLVSTSDLRLWLAGVAYGARTRDGELVDVDVPIELTAHRAVEPSIININTFSVFKSQQLNTNGQVRLISHIARISKRNVQSPGNETLHDVATWSSSLYRKLTRKSERMKCPHTWI